MRVECDHRRSRRSSVSCNGVLDERQVQEMNPWIARHGPALSKNGYSARPSSKTGRASHYSGWMALSKAISGNIAACGHVKRIYIKWAECRLAGYQTTVNLFGSDDLKISTQTSRCSGLVIGWVTDDSLEIQAQDI